MRALMVPPFLFHTSPHSSLSSLSVLCFFFLYTIMFPPIPFYWLEAFVGRGVLLKGKGKPERI